MYKNKELQKEYYLKNKERILSYGRVYHARNKTKRCLDKENHYKQNREKILERKKRTYPNLGRKNHLYYKFGMSIEEYNEMLILQKYSCAICGIMHESEQYKKLCVDHSHKTGKIRGLLCGHCNKGLGIFKDSIESLEKAMNYLKAREGENV